MKLRSLNSRWVLNLLGVVMAGVFVFAQPSPAAQTWQQEAARAAVKEGYRLIELKGLGRLFSTKESFILLDVRPDYEFKAGHLPGAVNLEFHLGDRSRLSPAKKTALEKILGPDKSIKVVIYCRSYS